MPSLPVALYPSVFLSADSWVVGRKASSEVESSRSEFPYNCQLRVLQNAETFNRSDKAITSEFFVNRFVSFCSPLLGGLGRIGLLLLSTFYPNLPNLRTPCCLNPRHPPTSPRRPLRFTHHASRFLISLLLYSVA